jgi:pre-rRNA-processing protein RIX1
VKSLKTTINSAHRVADRVFRAVLEDWQPSTRDAVTNGHTLDDEVQDLEPDNMALPAWSGLFAGSERLVHLLRILQQYLANPTANSVGLNISSIMDIVTRVLSLTAPGSGSRNSRDAIRLNTQVSKEERENLWLVLPDLHVGAIEVLLVLAGRSQSSTLPLDSLIIDQLVWVFASERDFAQTRSACYHAIAAVLKRSGGGLPKSSVDSLVPLMRACCEDLLPVELPTVTAKPTPGQSKANGSTPSQTTANADTFLNSLKGADVIASNLVGLTEAAHALLPVLLADVPAQYLSDALRSRLDRTATLTQHKQAMLASVLNPPPSKRFGKPAASVLPLLSRSFPASADIEGLLRPRMPAIRLGAQDTEMEEEDAEEDEEDEEEDEEVQVEETGDQEMEEPNTSEKEDDHFVGHELDTLLQSASQTEVVERDFATTDVEAASAQAVPGGDTGGRTAPTQGHETAFEVHSNKKESGKRAQTDQAQSTPSKRPKTGEEQSISSRTRSNSAAEAPANKTSVTALESSSFTVSNTASIAPELLEAGEAAADGMDSDEDDVVSLVLGQDTDDESE